jgi:hypothetical protein
LINSCSLSLSTFWLCGETVFSGYGNSWYSYFTCFSIFRNLILHQKKSEICLSGINTLRKQNRFMNERILLMVVMIFVVQNMIIVRSSRPNYRNYIFTASKHVNYTFVLNSLSHNSYYQEFIILSKHTNLCKRSFTNNNILHY